MSDDFWGQEDWGNRLFIWATASVAERTDRVLTTAFAAKRIEATALGAEIIRAMALRAERIGIAIWGERIGAIKLIAK